MNELYELARRWRIYFNAIRPNSSPSMEKLEAKNIFNLAMPSISVSSRVLHPPRYANNPTGTKHRATNF
jgi:hypothetical protein